MLPGSISVHLRHIPLRQLIVRRNFGVFSTAHISFESKGLVPRGINIGTDQHLADKPEAANDYPCPGKISSENHSGKNKSSLRQVQILLADINTAAVSSITKDPKLISSTVARLEKLSPHLLSHEEGKSILERLSPLQAHILIRLLCHLFKNDRSIKLIVLKMLRDLMFSKATSLQTNKKLIKLFMNTLTKYNQSLGNNLGEESHKWLMKLDALHSQDTNLASYVIQYNLFKIIIVCCLLSQMPLLASSFYISLVESKEANENLINYILLNNELLASITNSLLVLDPNNDKTNILTIVKLQEFQNSKLRKAAMSWTSNVDLTSFYFKLSNSQQQQLMTHLLMLDDRSALDLKIHIFDRVLHAQKPTSGSSNQLAVYLRYAYELIQSNIRLNNDAVVYFIWSRIESYHTVLYNAQISSPNNNPENNYYYYNTIARLIKFFSKNVRYAPLVDKLIQNIPIKACSMNPELMDAMLLHAARTEDMSLSDVLLQQLGRDDIVPQQHFRTANALTRGQLSSLLGLHLKFHDSEGVEKIVNLIYQKFPEGLDHVEMNLICKQMLKSREKNLQEQEAKVWKMFQSLEAHLGKSVAILYLDHMIETKKLDFNKVDYIYNKLLKRLPDTDEVWGWFTCLYFKYLTKNFPLYHAQKVFQNSKNEVLNYSTLDNPFNSTFDKARTYLPERVKKLVIKSILDSSIHFKRNTKVTFWCFQELEKLGYGYKETMLDLALSTKDAAIQTKLEFNLAGKTNKMPTDNIAIPGLTDEELKLSNFFEKKYEDLYLAYLKQKPTTSI